MAVLQGIDEFQDKLNRLDRDVRRKLLTSSLKRAVEITRRRAGEDAPFRTGRLARGQISAQIGSESTANRAVIRVGPSVKVFYGLFLEHGTVFMTRRPFLNPAFEQTRAEVLRIAAEEFKKAVEEAA